MANKINWGLSLDVCESMHPQVLEFYKQVSATGWKVWIVDSIRGYCNHSRKEITVPTWAVNRGTDYYNYYLSHELAHIFAGYVNQHNHIFMQEFKRVCPESFWKYELEYKPRNASKAGIGAFTLIDL
jgi:predicted metal-dependent hydrolase